MGNINELLENYYIHDCCIVNEDYIFIIAEEYLDEEADDYEDGDSGRIKMVSRILTEEPEDWGFILWEEKNSFYKPKLVNIKQNEVLIVSDMGLTYYNGLGKNKQYEERIPSAIAPGVASLKRIDGEVYLVAHRRTVTKREGVSQWKSLREDSMWNDELSPLNAGFEDIDGFSAKDLYAVGSDNDVWRYDGQDWIPLDISDFTFDAYTVCCADDGYVYIAGTWGVVIRGRENEWETYLPKDLESKTWYAGADSGFSSSVSYQGRVYLGGESIGTYYIDHNSDDITPKPYDFNGEIAPFSARFMSVGYGMMMFANQHRAALHDGEKWIDLYGGSKKSQSKDLGKMLTTLTNASEIIDKVREEKIKGKKSKK